MTKTPKSRRVNSKNFLMIGIFMNLMNQIFYKTVNFSGYKFL